MRKGTLIRIIRNVLPVRIGNPMIPWSEILFAIMDCGGISGTLAGNVPFESGGHSGATDLTYAGVV